MRHECVPMEELPPRLKELHQRRRVAAAKVGETAVAVCDANKAYSDAITELIQINAEIFSEENNQ